jgi:hypothetical protein
VLDQRLLSIYLNDHLAGSVVGAQLVRRAAQSNEKTSYGESFARLAQEISEDREALEELMRRLGVRRDPLKEAVAYAAEKVGRLKPNGRLISYSPLSRLVELEALQLAVTGKRALWRALRDCAAEEPRLAQADYDALTTRADNQLRAIERLRTRAAHEALLSDG